MVGEAKGTKDEGVLVFGEEVREEEGAEFALELLAERYPDLLKARYKSDDMPEGGQALLEWVGRRRGLLGRGGIIDRDRAADIVLRELQKGQIGRISFEGPDVRGLDDDDAEGEEGEDKPGEGETEAEAVESKSPASTPSGAAT